MVNSTQIVPAFQKKPFFKQFWWIFLIVAVAAGTTVLIVVRSRGDSSETKSTDDIQSGPEDGITDDPQTGENSLPACPDTTEGLFTNYLVEPDTLGAIEPLGNVNGIDHILPVDHVYFISYENGGTGGAPIYAPADIYITDVTSHQLFDSSGRMPDKPAQYYFYADVCNGLRIWVSGVGELSPELQMAWDQAEKAHSEDASGSTIYSINEATRPNIWLHAGDLIGYTHVDESIEITVTNQNLAPREDVDWSYYADASTRSHIMCFADLYAEDMKAEYYTKFGMYRTTDGFVPRTIEPLCGEVIQNISGTIQGDWFIDKPENENDGMEKAGKTLTFIHMNYDPTVGIISIAGTITDETMRIEYEPKHSGNIDRETSETITGQIYCYNTDQGIKIIAGLIDDHHLRIESQTGSCKTAETFDNPYIFER